MRYALIGRTEILIECGRRLCEAGHEPALVVTCKEAPEYTSNVDDFKRLAANWGVPFLRTTGSEVIAEAVRGLEPIEIGISLNFPSIISKAAVDAFSLGILNIHGGDLPRYRGNACHAWAILNREDHVGLCVHKMVAGELDSGDIIADARRPLSLDTKVTELWKWTLEASPGLVLEAVDALSCNPAFVKRRQSRAPEHALRCYPRRPEDCQINWRAPAESIVRLVNASNKPYRGAFCDLDGAELIVWDAELIADPERYLACPGQLTSLRPDRVEVATGDGKIALKIVQLDGEVMPATAVITSIRSRLR